MLSGKVRSIVGFSGFFQVAWVVPDLTVAAMQWVETIGVGPFLVFEDYEFESITYRGKPSKLKITGAIAQAGDIQIELIQQKCANPSAYRDTVAPGCTGLHHMAIAPVDYDAELSHYEKLGIAVAAQGLVGDVRFSYLDTSPVMGFMIEILDLDDVTRATYKLAADLAHEWDGCRPLRSFSDGRSINTASIT